jgi:hypothetical protein
MSKASKLLEKLADHLTDPNGEILLAAEHDQDVLNIVSFSLAKCAEVLKETARDILKLEGHDFDGEALEEMALVASELDGDVEFSKYSESIDNVLDLLSKKDSDISVDLENIVNLAAAFDESGDPELGKKASVLDEILLTIGAPKGSNYTFKSAEEAELIKLREKYRADSSKFYGVGKERTDKIADESNKVIEQKVKKYKPNEHALSTRYCCDHPGVSVIRIGDNTVQCPLDKKIYNYESGFKLEDGSIVPPGSVSEQSQQMSNNSEQRLNFSTREDILNV